MPSELDYEIEGLTYQLIGYCSTLEGRELLQELITKLEDLLEKRAKATKNFPEENESETGGKDGKN